MRRLSRYILNGLTLLSLLLCVAVVVLWVRSHRANETVGWWSEEWGSGEGPGRARGYGASSDSGGLLLFALHRSVPRDSYYYLGQPGRSAFNYFRDEPIEYPYMRMYERGGGAFGFGYFAGGRTDQTLAPVTCDDTFVTVPYWALAAASLVAPARHASAFGRRRRRARRGRCPGCGYDLRTTPGRCPECGKAARLGA